MMFQYFNVGNYEYQTPRTLVEEENYERPLSAGEDPDFMAREKQQNDLQRVDEKMNREVTKDECKQEAETSPSATPAPSRGWLSRIGSTLAWAFTPGPDAANGLFAYQGPGAVFPTHPFFGADPELSMALWGLNNRSPEQETMRDGEEVEDMIRRVSMSPIASGDPSGTSRGIGARWESARRSP